MKLILLEFNELCPTLMQSLIDRGALPNFKRLYDRSEIYLTNAGEAPPHLEPWIQWPTVHSGLPFARHGISELGQGHRLPHKCVGQLLSDAGFNVGIFGSMNLNYRDVRGFVIPDPWNKEFVPEPASLQSYHEIISRQVHESSRPDSLGATAALRLGGFLFTHGLSMSTSMFAVKHLMAEARDKGLAWRRASVLDHLQYDVFRNFNRKMHVDFATFFCNSTAHYQHYFWRNFEPEKFSVPPLESDHESLSDAIPYGYASMDIIVGRMLRDFPEHTICLCTALSQQPWNDTTKCTFRPVNFDRFLSFAGIRDGAARVSPVMAEQFQLDFTTEADCVAALDALNKLEVSDDSRPLMFVRRDGPTNLFCGAQVFSPVPIGTRIRGNSGQETDFGELLYMIHSMRSGFHHPQGMLWIGTGAHRVAGDNVPLTDVAPTLLRLFGVPQPHYMQGQPLPIDQGLVAH